MKKIMYGLLLVASGLILAGCSKNYNPANLNDTDTTKVTIGAEKYELEVARSVDAQRRGLSGRKELDKNKGMLFIYDQSDYPQFWMKDTSIPLQLIFIDNCTIVEIKEMSVEKDPSRPEAIYKSGVKANKAIELSKGTLPENSIGSKIKELCD